MTKKFIIVFSVLLMLFSVSACGSQDSNNNTSSATQSTMTNTETNTTPNEQLSQNQETVNLYETIADPILKKADYQGITYISYSDKVLFDKGYGKANIEKNIAVTSDTVFCIASNSKQFTATAIMLLQQSGKLSVNDTIDKYFPEYPYGNQITVHQLLCMRSGIKDYMNYAEDIVQDISSNLLSDENTTAKEVRQAIQQWFFKQELDFTPDEQFAYSNSNYMLLAEIVEQLSGMPYEEYIRQNIFEPLAMNDTTFYDLYDITSDNFAQPTDDTYTDYMQYKGILFGAGDIVSTAKDLGKWFTAVRNHTIVSEDILKTMTTNYSEDSNYSYGYGYGTDEYGFCHTGEIFSYVSITYVSTIKDFNIILLSNAPTTKVESLALAINNGLLSSGKI